MLNEEILIAGGGNRERVVKAKDLLLDDVEYLGLFLDDASMKQLRYAQRTAGCILGIIQKRESSKKVEEVAQVDIPDLYSISKKLPSGDGWYLLEFWSILMALAKHWLPDAKEKVYRIHGKNGKNGIRLEGKCWYSKGGKDESVQA